jgi:hypothetical protein
MPSVTKPAMLHLILEVSDNGTPRSPAIAALSWMFCPERSTVMLQNFTGSLDVRTCFRL